jgi:hypothetical protein
VQGREVHINGGVTMTGIESNIFTSAVFVLLGSLAFHISTLISGYNIYKDMSQFNATIISIAVGVLQFFLSPISFIIFFPKELCINNTECLVSSNTITEIWGTKNIISFVFITFGFGLIFGSFKFLKLRDLALKYFRAKSGFQFPIHSYQYAWDNLLRRVKPGGNIILDLGDKAISGKLRGYSTGDEPKGILISTSDFIYGTVKNHDVLIVDSGVKKIIVPEYSFRKHLEHSSHSTQAFYSIIASFGFMSLSFGILNTSKYINNEHLKGMSNNYAVLAYIIYFIILIMLVAALTISFGDFKKKRGRCLASFHISPVVSILVFASMSIYTHYILNEYTQRPYGDIYILMYCVDIIMILVLCLSAYWQKCIYELYKRINSIFESDMSLFDEIADEFTTKFDLNNNECKYIDIFKNELITKYDNSKINKLFAEIEDYIFKYKYLKGEDNNLILRMMLIRKARGEKYTCN